MEVMTKDVGDSAEVGELSDRALQQLSCFAPIPQPTARGT